MSFYAAKRLRMKLRALPWNPERRIKSHLLCQLGYAPVLCFGGRRNWMPAKAQLPFANFSIVPLLGSCAYPNGRSFILALDGC